ncbi:MAG TPA: hypothetical protein VFS43_43890 [Polyangiaceae bacterium]|nr:hypothetical protein [Polyangiaceae bacterium]
MPTTPDAMKPEEIRLGDWKRILLGNAPVAFLLETFARPLGIYLALVVVLRLFGERMTGQLAILEMSVMVALGAIVAVPMHMPDRGVLVGRLLLVRVLGLQRGLGRLGVERRRVELATQGDLTSLVKDGILLTL